ncbi:MAG: hypothetical protein RL190_1391 [Actinomycetota bacterium]
MGAALAAAALVGGFAALGGADRLRPAEASAAAPTPEECAAAEPEQAGGTAEALAAEILLASIRDASCRLGVPRADLVLALGQSASVADAAGDLGVEPAALEEAVLGSIEDAVAAAEADGRITPATALAVRTLVDVVPPDRLLAAAQGGGDSCGELPWKPVDTLDEVAAQIGIKTGLRTACALGIAPLEAVTALADPAGLEGLVGRSGRGEAEVTEAVRTAIGESLVEAEAAGALTSTEATVLGAAARVAPVERLLAIVRGDDDPCEPFPWPGSETQGEALAAVVLIGAVDAACALDAPTFDVFAALASQEELDQLLASTGRSQAEVEEALRSGLDRGLDAAQEADAISGIEALLLRAVLSQVGILDLLRNFSA